MHGIAVTETKFNEMVLGAAYQQCLILDTNVILHQLDIIEYDCPATNIVVILQTVLQELKHLNLSVYKRIYGLLKNEKKSFVFFPNELNAETFENRVPSETANDYNDRLIRIATAHFQRAVSKPGNVILISNDAIQRVSAIAGVLSEAYVYVCLPRVCRPGRRRTTWRP